MNLLRLKAALVGTPFEDFARALRWYVGTFRRFKYPELQEVELENRRLPDVLRKILPYDACCVDVGCHIGSFLSLIIKLFPAGNHVAIEASPSKSRWLQSKFRRATIHNVAIAHRAGRAVFEDNRRRPGYSRLLNNSSRNPDNYYYEVEVTTLDKLLVSIPRINLLKLDIEGGELAALQGAVCTIARCRPIILFEVASEQALDMMQVSRRELYDTLKSMRYDLFTFTDILYGKGPLEYSEFQKCGLWPFRAFNFVAMPNENSQPGKVTGTELRQSPKIR